MTEEFKSYDELKAEIDKDANKFKDSAAKRIPKLANALKVENPAMPKEEIKEIILKDFLQYWTRKTIMDALGNDYKDPEHVEIGKKGAKDKKKLTEMISVTAGGGSITNPPPADKPPSEEKKVDDKLNDIGVDLKQDRINELEKEKAEWNIIKENMQKKINQLSDVTAIHSVKPASQIVKEDAEDKEVFELLRKRSKETSNIIHIPEVFATSLVTSLSQYRTAFKKGELFVRVIS